jgi:S-DNA-T family DNA segregation ATPase FtsK/SpoIIIE
MKEAAQMAAYEAPGDGKGPIATVTRLPGAAGSEPAHGAGEETPNLPAIPGEPGTPEAGGQHAPARAVYADIARAPGERLPILPPSLRGRENIRAALVLAAGQTWHRARYHGLRSPLYLVAVLVWAFIGACRLVMRQVHWWWVLEQHGLRSQAAAAGDSREWMRLHKEAKATRQVRGLVLLGEALGLTVAAVALARYAPVWALAALAGGLVLFFARAGRPAGHRIVGTAIVPPDYSPPTHEIITRALGSLGIAQINAVLKPDKDGRVQGIRFVSDVMRDGPGWTCHLDLPHGVSASDILARRESLASGLRRPLSATWPAGVPEEHPGRLDLWVGMHDISKQKPPPCPLVKARQTDLFDVLAFGTDPRLRPVKVPMFEVNWLIGASPGQGKTAAVRVLGCGAALDPLADLWVHELAGKGDLEPLAKVCHRYCSGLDDESIGYAAESARLLRNETERRSAMFKRLKGSGLMPDGKVTRELAARYSELRPLVAIFDEVQNVLTDKQHGDQAAEDLAYVIRVGRAYGIIAVLSTQRPDAKIIPTAITGLIVSRFCLMVPDQPANDLVLGTTSYRRGFDATVFRPKVDAGLGWLKGGEDGIPQICRTFYLDLPATEKIATRAREMRDRAGVLTGYALGEAEVAEKRDVLADVAAVFGTDKGLQWEELAERLADRWPGRWADVTADAISAQCRRLGVPSVDVRSGGSVRKGCRKVGVDKATGP